jgi:hypothetical protein
MSTSERFEQYEVLRRDGGGLWEIGRGAMGVTYKAFDTDLHCEVALKVINPTILDNEEVGQRFLREARSLARLRHPNIATVYRLGKSAGGSYFYAMEFCEGETLEQRVERAGPLDAEQTLEIALQVSKALILAEEQHMVHRDIKPANLILTERRDEGIVVKVIDFGLAKIYGQLEGANQSAWASLSMAGFIGTAHFASPEQLEEKELDSRADIYSLGATLWYGLTGKSLFSGSLAQIMSQHLSVRPPVEELPSYVPGPLRNLLAHMLEKDREQRPADVSELKREILECKERLRNGADTVAGGRASFTLLELLRARQGLNLSEVLRLLEPMVKQVDEAEKKKQRLELAKHEVEVEFLESGANVAELLYRPVGEWPRFRVLAKPAGSGGSNLADQTLLSMATVLPVSRSGSERSQKQELGLLVYELLGGVPPRVGSSSGYVPLPRLTSEGNAVLQRAVSTRPDQQFPTAKDFYDSLSSTAGYEPLVRRRQVAGEVADEPSQKSWTPILWVGTACAVAVLITFGAWIALRERHSTAAGEQIVPRAAKGTMATVAPMRSVSPYSETATPNAVPSSQKNIQSQVEGSDGGRITKPEYAAQPTSGIPLATPESSPTPVVQRATQAWDKPHIYLQLASEAQRKAAGDLKRQLVRSGYVVVNVEVASGNQSIPTEASELRYFSTDDAGEAQSIAMQIAPFFGAQGIFADLPEGMPYVSHTRQYEIWFSKIYRNKSVTPPSVERSAAGDWAGTIHYTVVNGQTFDIGCRITIDKDLQRVTGRVEGSDSQTVSARVSGNSISWSWPEGSTTTTIKLTPNADDRSARVTSFISQSGTRKASGSGIFQKNR